MSYTFAITDGGCGVVTVYSGNLTAAELRESQQERVRAIPDGTRIRYLLNDYTGALAIDVGIEAVVDHAQEVVARVGELGDGLLIAFAISDRLAHGLARVWMGHVNASAETVQVFATRSAAEAWLRERTGLDLTYL